MAYCVPSDLLNYIDSINLSQMTADYADAGSPNSSAILTNLCQLASDKADSYIASIYPVPYISPTIPSKLRQASIVFAVFMLWARRLTPEEKNPMAYESKFWQDTLINIGNGNIPLDANFPRSFIPVYTRVTKSPLNTNIF